MESLYREKGNTSKYYAFRPSEDYEQVDILKIDDKEFKLNITFKSVMKLIEILSSDYLEEFKLDKGLKILGFKEDLTLEIKSFLFGKIMDYLFKSNESSSSRPKIFDLTLDYRYYYCDFRNLSIDLNKDNISWLEFDMLLEGILLNKDSVISQVIGFRSYKKPSKNIRAYEAEEHKYYLQKQRQYSLPQSQSFIDEGMSKMWDYLEKQSEVKNNE